MASISATFAGWWGSVGKGSAALVPLLQAEPMSIRKREPPVVVAIFLYRGKTKNVGRVFGDEARLVCYACCDKCIAGLRFTVPDTAGGAPQLHGTLPNIAGMQFCV